MSTVQPEQAEQQRAATSEWVLRLGGNPGEDDIAMTLPPDLMAALDMEGGGTLVWRVAEDGRVTVRKKG